MKRLKVFYTNDFVGHWPVGTSAVVIAANSDDARILMNAKLKEHGLADRNKADDYTLLELDTSRGQAIILQDGDY